MKRLLKLSVEEIIMFAIEGLEKNLDDVARTAKICRKYDLNRFENLSYEFTELLEKLEDIIDAVRNIFDEDLMCCYDENYSSYVKEFYEIWRL